MSRDKTWDLGSGSAPYPQYDALRDSNLRQYFESRQVQQFLHQMGWVDKEGRIVDLDKHKSKLNIIEQEFKYAEKAEYWRMKEEEEMRVRKKITLQCGSCYLHLCYPYDFERVKRKRMLSTCVSIFFLNFQRIVLRRESSRQNDTELWRRQRGQSDSRD